MCDIEVENNKCEKPSNLRRDLDEGKINGNTIANFSTNHIQCKHECALVMLTSYMVLILPVNYAKFTTNCLKIMKKDTHTIRWNEELFDLIRIVKGKRTTEKANAMNKFKGIYYKILVAISLNYRHISQLLLQRIMFWSTFFHFSFFFLLKCITQIHNELSCLEIRFGETKLKSINSDHQCSTNCFQWDKFLQLMMENMTMNKGD